MKDTTHLFHALGPKQLYVQLPHLHDASLQPLVLRVHAEYVIDTAQMSQVQSDDIESLELVVRLSATISTAKDSRMLA